MIFPITDKLISLTVTDHKTHLYHLSFVFLKSFGKVLGKEFQNKTFGCLVVD